MLNIETRKHAISIISRIDVTQIKATLRSLGRLQILQCLACKRTIKIALFVENLAPISCCKALLILVSRAYYE